MKAQINVNKPTSGCQRIVAVRDIATEALWASLESLLTSEDPVKKKKKSIHIVSGTKFAAKCQFSPNSTVTKPSKSSSESESSVHCCRAAVKTRRNSKEWSPKLDQNETILPDMRLKNTDMRRNYLWSYSQAASNAGVIVLCVHDWIWRMAMAIGDDCLRWSRLKPAWGGG